MRLQRFVLPVLLLGCPADPADPAPTLDGGADAALDARAPGPDRALPDAAADMLPPPDAAPDMQLPPADMLPPTDMLHPDMTPDARPPADLGPAPMDAAVDATPDLDATPDMRAADMAVIDMAAPDMAAPDMAPDLAVDMAPDMGPDPLARPPVGFCAPVRPEGWGCFGDDRACDGDLTCIDGLCTPLSPREGPCDGNSDCLPGQDLYCKRYTDDGARLERPICQLRTPETRPCHRRNFGCQAGLVCVLDVCQQRSDAGGPCVTSGDCNLEFWCDVDARCAPYIQLGEVCNPNAPGCEPGLICLDERCAERRPPEDGCRNGGDCAIGHYCDLFEDSGDRREQGVCTPRLVEGDPCDDREAVICSASVCLEGRCVADQPEEGACRSTFDCEAGFWCPRAF